MLGLEVGRGEDLIVGEIEEGLDEVVFVVGEEERKEVGTGEEAEAETHPQLFPGLSPQLQQQWSPDKRMQVEIIGCSKGLGDALPQFQALVPQVAKTADETGAEEIAFVVTTGADEVLVVATTGADEVLVVVTTGAEETTGPEEGLLVVTIGVLDGRVVDKEMGVLAEVIEMSAQFQKPSG